MLDLVIHASQHQHGVSSGRSKQVCDMARVDLVSKAMKNLRRVVPAESNGAGMDGSSAKLSAQGLLQVWKNAAAASPRFADDKHVVRYTALAK